MVEFEWVREKDRDGVWLSATPSHDSRGLSGRECGKHAEQLNPNSYSRELRGENNILYIAKGEKREERRSFSATQHGNDMDYFLLYMTSIQR